MTQGSNSAQHDLPNEQPAATDQPAPALDQPAQFAAADQPAPAALKDQPAPTAAAIQPADSAPALAALQRRLASLVRGMLATHADALLALLAEQGVQPAEQRARVDRLIRALQHAQFEPTLVQQGRAVPIIVALSEDDAEKTDNDADNDPDSDPVKNASEHAPTIRLNAALFEGIDDAALLRACHGPIAQILALSPVAVGLVLQSEDERHLKMLVQQACRRGGVERVWRSQIPALTEQHVALFQERLDALSRFFAADHAPAQSPEERSSEERSFEERSSEERSSEERSTEGRDEFLQILSEARGDWPDWEQIVATRFILRAIDGLREEIVERPGIPDAPLLVELCWESLELSTQAFLQHAARVLRAQSSTTDLTAALNSFREIFRKKGDLISEDARDWPVFGELSQAWRALYRMEQRSLPKTPVEVAPPILSVFQPPGRSLRLNEPASLPWQAPLLAWTVREHQALRDLLVGFKQALKTSGPCAAAENPHSPGMDADPTSFRGELDEEPLGLDEPTEDFKIEVMRQSRALPADHAYHLKRAVDACQQLIRKQFLELDDAQKLRALQTLRAAYSGYFSDARLVWQRRFQAWKSWPPAHALHIFTRELHHLLGPAMIFDPLAAPDDPTLAPMPNFVLVIPRISPHDRPLAHLPLEALRRGIHGSGVRVRLVDVPSDAPCAWVGDICVSSTEIEEYPTEHLLGAIENDCVRIMVHPLDDA